MNVLLDTQALILAAHAPTQLSASARRAIHAPTAMVYVSAASAWEIATKVRLGKLPEAQDLEERFHELVVNRAGYTLLSITVDDALRAGRLAGAHKDPFDRMIAAQALTLDIPVVSIDTQLDSFGVRRIW
jgi:PIN domain nuclease of toxin-antitoxin system